MYAKTDKTNVFERIVDTTILSLRSLHQAVKETSRAGVQIRQDIPTVLDRLSRLRESATALTIHIDRIGGLEEIAIAANRLSKLDLARHPEQGNDAALQFGSILGILGSCVATFPRPFNTTAALLSHMGARLRRRRRDFSSILDADLTVVA